MRFTALVFKPGYGGSYEGPGPNFAIIEYNSTYKYGTLTSSMVPQLSYEHNTVDHFAAPWLFKTDREGNNLKSRILQECELIHVLVRVDWNG